MFFMLGAEGTRGEYNAVRHASHPWYKGFNIIIPDKLIEMEKAKTEVKLDRPMIVGQAVLDVSKFIMYRFWYEKMLRQWGQVRETCERAYAVARRIRPQLESGPALTLTFFHPSIRM